MKLEFVRFVDIGGDILYLRMSKISSIYVDSESGCTVVELDNGEFYYVKGRVDEVARSFLEREIGNVYSFE